MAYTKSCAFAARAAASIACGDACGDPYAILLAIDRPEASAGQIYNCGDERLLTLRQTIEIIARTLNYDLEIVSMPWDLAVPARPMIAQPWTTHRVLDLTKIRSQLGYSDAVPPERGIALTAKWLVEHPERGKAGERILQDPFDYRAEDEIIAAWKKLCAEMPATKFEREPGYTASYTGPGGRRRSGSFE